MQGHRDGLHVAAKSDEFLGHSGESFPFGRRAAHYDDTAFPEPLSIAEASPLTTATVRRTTSHLIAFRPIAFHLITFHLITFHLMSSNITPAVNRFLNRHYKCPVLRRDQLRKFAMGMEKMFILPPDSPGEDQLFFEELKSAILHSKLSDVMKPGSGLPPTIGLPSMHTVVLFDVILEVVHLMDFGHFAYASEAGIIPSPSDVIEWERSLPQYPGTNLVVYLSDGVTELEGRAYRPFGIRLGSTPIGLKIRLAAGVPAIGGIAYLEPSNVVIMGGHVESRQDEHAARLRSDIRLRMKAHLATAKVIDHLSPFRMNLTQTLSHICVFFEDPEA
ncbi:hypothetical protein H1R20_g4142, partial [Candolleomyces eurysporus]